MFIFEDDYCVELTKDQQTFMDTHGVGMDRFREATDNDMEVSEHISFGDLVTLLVDETDLLVEHDAAHWDR